MNKKNFEKELESRHMSYEYCDDEDRNDISIYGNFVSLNFNIKINSKELELVLEFIDKMEN